MRKDSVSLHNGTALRSASGTSIFWATLLIAIVAAVPRFYGLQDAVMAHYDGAVYVYSARSMSAGGFLHPTQIERGPLGYPLLVSLAFRLLDSSDARIAFLVNALIGVLTCVAVFLVGIRYMGWGSALFSGLLLAVNDCHIVYCRTALTDPLFTLLTFLALSLFIASCERKSVGLSALAGLFTGAAWHTKYHGFFPVVIMAAYVLLTLPSLLKEKPSDWPKRGLIQLVCAGLISVVVFLPWLVYVDRTIGIGHVLADKGHHLHFFESWVRNFSHQMKNFTFFRHYGAIAAALTISTGAWVAVRRGGRRSVAFCVTGCAIGGIIFGGIEFVGFAFAVPAVRHLYRRESVWATFPILWAAVFWLFLPLYDPVSRLALPLLPLLALLAVSEASELLKPIDKGTKGQRWSIVTILLVLMVLVLRFGHFPVKSEWSEWQSRFGFGGGYSRAAAIISEVVPSNAVIACHTQPPFLYYAPRSVVRVGDQDFRQALSAIAAETSGPIFIATDVKLSQNPTARASLAALAGELSEVVTVENVLGLPSLLDLLAPDELWKCFRNGSKRIREWEVIKVYKWTPDPPLTESESEEPGPGPTDYPPDS